MSTYKIADLFAGIGGTRLGFDRAFRDTAQTVYVCELDPYARKTYFANFDLEGAVVDSDITKVDEKNVPDFDICLAGFPCQAFSMAGQRGGFEDNYRGGYVAAPFFWTWFAFASTLNLRSFLEKTPKV